MRPVVKALAAVTTAISLLIPAVASAHPRAGWYGHPHTVAHPHAHWAWHRRHHRWYR